MALDTYVLYHTNLWIIGVIGWLVQPGAIHGSCIYSPFSALEGETNVSFRSWIGWYYGLGPLPPLLLSKRIGAMSYYLLAYYLEIL